ncbi:hypothetical protein PAPYR_4978 [Paratrimastix pyriformis]|uniref:Uncharacterized protein n=1 Tax=Paratrimastix pyriformis TaxID=342808 RepID=A0ABQ8UIW8_9EUKA|nr:hypothetical protein PAPYR_4978 [Paratrimastix pyriformis]
MSLHYCIHHLCLPASCSAMRRFCVSIALIQIVHLINRRNGDRNSPIFDQPPEGPDDAGKFLRRAVAHVSKPQNCLGAVGYGTINCFVPQRGTNNWASKHIFSAQGLVEPLRIQLSQSPGKDHSQQFRSIFDQTPEEENFYKKANESWWVRSTFGASISKAAQSTWHAINLVAEKTKKPRNIIGQSAWVASTALIVLGIPAIVELERDRRWAFVEQSLGLLDEKH